MPAEDKNILKYNAGEKSIKRRKHNLHGPQIIVNKTAIFTK